MEQTTTFDRMTVGPNDGGRQATHRRPETPRLRVSGDIRLRRVEDDPLKESLRLCIGLGWEQSERVDQRVCSSLASEIAGEERTSMRVWSKTHTH
jgi:hypothetical protein